MGYRFTDNNGTFEMENADANSYLYFPLCNEAGLKGCVTPLLGGDLMLDQNRFVLQPTSVSDLHNNKSTRNFWLRFDDGTLRSATGASVWQRAERAEGITVRAGLLWHETETLIHHGDALIRSDVLTFIPVDATTAQIIRVRLKNEGNTAIGFEPCAVVPLYGRSAVNLRDHRHVTSLLHRVSTEEYGVRLKPTLSFDERGHLKNRTEYFVLGCDEKGGAPAAFLPGTDDIIGEGGDYELPLGLMGGRLSDRGVPAGTKREGEEGAGGLIFEKKVLSPGESTDYLLFIGAKEEDNEYNSAEAVLERFGSSERIDEALEANRVFWLEKARAGLPGVREEEEEPDRYNFMLWVAAEPVMRRIFGCSFLPYHDYGKGGRGWRDLWQDCLALMLSGPEQVRDLLINNFAGVRADGTNATIIGSRPGEFIADRNGIARVWMDHGVWPWITMRLYTELSGDTGVLDTEQYYFKDRLCMRARGTDDGEYAPGETPATLLRDAGGQAYKGTVLEHILMMHLTAACDVGEHGNMLLRGADWNDALDMADKKGESVAFTAAYAGNLRTLAEEMNRRPGSSRILEELSVLLDGLYAICKDRTASDHASRKRGILEDYCRKVRHTVSGRTVEISNSELAVKLDAIADSIMADIRENEIMKEGDLSWFNGYYDNEGRPAESLKDGRLMLTGAVFALMSGTAQDGIIDGMIRSAEKYLFRGDIGGFRLNTRFENEEYYAHNMGRMFGFAYGSKENGAVFCHMAVMYAYALLIRGRRAEADRVIDCLIGQSMDFEKARIYPGIPEYFDINGRGMYPYLTGAASWLLLYYYRRRKV